MQSGSIERDIYVHPPREKKNTQKGTLWKLLKLPYGVLEAGRKCTTVLEGCLTNEMGMEQARGISQVFVKRRKDGSISMIVTKLSEESLLSGDLLTINNLVTKLTMRFKASKAIIDPAIKFNGCRIEQERIGNIAKSMKDYLRMIMPLEMSRMRRKE